MALDIDQTISSACGNKFTCLPSLREFDVVLAELLYEVKVALEAGGGGGGLQYVFSGIGDPTGVVTPTATAAIYFDTSTGVQWNWYSGSWH